MTKTIAITTALMLSTASFGFAQSRHSGTTSPGASKYSPGHEMNSKTPGPGASQLSPGHEKRTVGQTKGASELSPGDRMNDTRMRKH